jgi:hypothetical protein
VRETEAETANQAVCHRAGVVDGACCGLRWRQLNTGASTGLPAVAKAMATLAPQVARCSRESSWIYKQGRKACEGGVRHCTGRTGSKKLCHSSNYYCLAAPEASTA